MYVKGKFSLRQYDRLTGKVGERESGMLPLADFIVNLRNDFSLKLVRSIWKAHSHENLATGAPSFST